MKRMIVVCALLAGMASEAAVKTEKDVAYATQERCRLDVRWPTGVTNFATVVWFHGGGLTGGRRSFNRLDEDIAQVTVGYRLMSSTNSVRVAECVDDAAAAVAWALEHIAEYGGDPKKVFVSGHSAGGYLTMMVGMDPRHLLRYGHSNMELAGLAPISGQATKHFAVRKFSGDRDPQFRPKIDEWAPLRYCTGKIPPIIAICGQEPWEWNCRSEENRLMISSLRALGHGKAWFVSLPFANHNQALAAGLPYLEFFIKGTLPRHADERR